MKKSLLMMLIALGALVGCGIVGRAQGRPIVGGYKEVAADSPEVQEAAEFAVSAEAEKSGNTIKLVSVEHAESQVVAGMNYRLCLKVDIEDKTNNVETTQEVKVVVYRKPKKESEFSLTSWEEEECSENNEGGNQN